VTTKKKEVARERLLHTRPTFSQSLMVSVDTTKLGCTDLVFVGVGPVRYMTISVHGADHFGTTTSVHIAVQLRYTERALYVPFHSMQISCST